MTFSLWVPIAALALVAVAAAALLALRARAASGATDGAEPQTGDAASAEAPVPADDPAADFGLDPEEWAPMPAGTLRRGGLRGLLRGRRRLAALAGEPHALFEHRDGSVLVGYDAGRSYAGRPRWAEVSALTLQMGLAADRWPGTAVSGAIRYRDHSMPLAYSPELFEDLRAAARRGKARELPDYSELNAGSGGGQPA